MEAQNGVIWVTENNLKSGILILWYLDLQPAHIDLEETLEMPNHFVLQRRKWDLPHRVSRSSPTWPCLVPSTSGGVMPPSAVGSALEGP